MRDHEIDSEAEAESRISERVKERQAEGPEATVPGRDLPPSQPHSLLQLQRRQGNRYVQRVVAQAKQEEGEAELAPEVEETIQRARGGGQPLEEGVRARMEPAFGADFSGVRVHTDAEADTLNRALLARAFTIGQDIFFRQGEYNPGSPSGRELLAHELTHVRQQAGAKAQGKLAIGQPATRHEKEADRVAQAIQQHRTGAVSLWPVQHQDCETDSATRSQTKLDTYLAQRKASTKEELAIEVLEEVPTNYTGPFTFTIIALDTIGFVATWAGLPATFLGAFAAATASIFSAVLSIFLVLYQLGYAAKVGRAGRKAKGMKLGLLSADLIYRNYPKHSCERFILTAEDLEKTVKGSTRYYSEWISSLQTPGGTGEALREGLREVARILNEGMDCAEADWMEWFDEKSVDQEREYSESEKELVKDSARLDALALMLDDGIRELDRLIDEELKKQFHDIEPILEK